MQFYVYLIIIVIIIIIIIKIFIISLVFHNVMLQLIRNK